jgi:type II secretory pathway predicted ATPase ExeA
MVEGTRRDGDAAAWWGAVRMPFDTAQPRRWPETPRHAEALARLEYLARHESGCGAILGPPGSGKSWLLHVGHALLQRLPAIVCRVNAAGADESICLRDMAAQLGLGLPPTIGPLALWQAMTDLLDGLRSVGEPVVLLLDDLDRAPEQTVSAVARWLRDPALAAGLVVVWAARTPLADTLAEELGPLVDLRIELAPLSAEETLDYVDQSLRRAGISASVMERDALRHIHERTGGDLRRVDRLCRFALLAAMAEERETVSADVVEALASEVGLRS